MVIMAILFSIGAFQSIFYSTLLFTKKNKKIIEVYLASFFLIVALYFINISLSNLGIWKSFPNLIISYLLVHPLIGLTLYLYLKSIVKINFKVQIKHFIITLFIVLSLLPILLLNNDLKIELFTKKYKDLQWYIPTIIFLNYLITPLYFGSILILLNKYKQKIKLTNKFQT